MSGSGEFTQAGTRPERRPASLEEIRRSHPRFIEALLADARISSAHRGRPLAGLANWRVLVEAARLCVSSDAFMAQAAYRASARLRSLRIPLLPRILHRASIVLAQVSIGEPVVVRPGLYLPHGQVVIDGFVVIGFNTVISPFVTIGRRGEAPEGPLVGHHVSIGTGAKILGRIEVGGRARVGANALVTEDVPPGATVVAPRAQPVGSDGGGGR